VSLRTAAGAGGAALVLLCARAAAAQTAVVYGAVRTASGAPIPNAQVGVRGTALVALADGAGSYTLTGIPAGRVIVYARVVAYAQAVDTLQLAAGDSIRVDFLLLAAGQGVEGVVTLPPTIVTAAKRSQLLDQAVTSVAVVSETELARLAVTTVDEAVDRAAGVQFISGQVNIRGSSGFVQGLGSRVLMVVDGVPVNQGDRGGIDWDLVPLVDVQRVEILKGAGSSLYGSAALGGVVNVITRDITPGVHARLRATSGSYANPPHDVWTFRDYTGSEEGVDASGSYGTERVRASVTGGGWHSDGYREQDRRNHWATAGKLESRPDAATRVTASGAWASDQYETPLVWCTRGTCDDRGQAYQPFMIDTAGRGAFTRADKGYVSATLERTGSDRIAWLARGSWGRTHFTDYQRTGNDAAVANRFGAELRAVVHPAADRVVTVGGEGAHSGVASNIFGEHSQSEVGAYGESEQRFGRTRVTAGARIDYIAVDGGGLSAVVSPRVGAVLETGSGAWRVSAGRGFRAPSLAERFVATVVQGIRVIPNPNLAPETAWSFEIGTTAHATAVRADAALFWTEAYDLIEPTVTTGSASIPQIQFKNLARTRLVGLDLSFGASPLTPRLTTAVAYTLLYARELAHDSVPEGPLAFRPRHLLTLSADYQWRAVSVGGDYRYTSRFERVELYPGDPRVAGQVLDLRAGWERGPLAIRCQVTNALNYIYNQVPRTLAPVRTLWVSATWTY
jgi:outer membrane cobalamin receptor